MSNDKKSIGEDADFRVHVSSVVCAHVAGEDIEPPMARLASYIDARSASRNAGVVDTPTVGAVAWAAMAPTGFIRYWSYERKLVEEFAKVHRLNVSPIIGVPKAAHTAPDTSARDAALEEASQACIAIAANPDIAMAVEIEAAAKAIRALKSQPAPAPAGEALTDDQLMAAGAPMANVMYNLAQRQGYVLTDADCEMYSNLRLSWDAAILAKSKGQA